jgi:transcription-repair coupling factor (superfamily II helicase)
MKGALESFASQFTPPGVIPAGGGVLLSSNPISIPSLTGSADAFLAVTLAQAKKAPQIVLTVTPGVPDADRISDDLKILTASEPTRILEFPPLFSGDKSALGTRLKTIAAIKAWALSPYPAIIVAAYPALASPIPLGTIPAIILGGDAQPINLTPLGDKLSAMGYRRVPTVEAEGDFSIRGGILDAWSPGEEFPVRAEFFGDDLESLRTFNPATQISVDRISSAEFLPIESDGDNERLGSLMDLLPADSPILAIEHCGYNLAQLIGDNADTNQHPIIYTGDPAPSGVATYNFQTAPLPGFAELGADEAHHPELFDAARQRLERHITSSKNRGNLVLHADELSGGFEIGALTVVTKSDRIFAKRKTRLTRAGKGEAYRGQRLNDFDDLDPGEYVVHVDFGVGRYIGSSEIVVDGKHTETFNIEYDGGLLHVPAAHAHLMSRYIGVKGEEVRLHRLDGKRWIKDKKEAQRAVADLAAALLETQARRETVPGFAYDIDCDGINAFEAAFPYEETPDQLAAISAIKSDLAANKPMDRLICGDAGYGKTEVAMRAAYIAAMNGKQVAVLAPTTVLAEQHFETFTSRFDGTPIRIESVSRFQTSNTHKGTFQRIESGVCDIVIGTHAILSPKIHFRDLGLIIIDEEQRFGVRHKEYLKQLRATADVLTLSATPIPRTLYLSMTGARDLSLLRSPPRERVAVETKVVRDNDEIVRAAILGEIERGGQVFFLHNRVSTIGKVEKRIAALVPEARIVVAHGQMDAKTLARKMRAFERGEFNILISTTIIESGIDIPRANTIIVDRADNFGMADLYQLRGRVGRSSRQGYACFLLPPTGIIDSDARERLSALQRHGGLGAGFNLAMRDLEIRGAGNLLGSQQSGHIAAVGFSLYCQLLQRTIAVLKGEKVKDIVDVKLNLDFITLSPSCDDDNSAAALPYDYVEEDSQRINFMKRFAEATDNKAINMLAAELEDRFGKMPAAARRFVKLAKLKVAAAAAGYESIDSANGRAIYRKAGSNAISKVIEFTNADPDRRINKLIAECSEKT